MSSAAEDYPTNPVKYDQSWYEEFADKLITENFLLTALEFHAELTESGRELTRLKDFFSNPGNFEHQATNKPEVLSPGNIPRSSSQITLDSLDLTRYSEDGERSNDEKVAILEFELRKAKEMIGALRANLTFAAESETNKQRSPEEKVKETKISHHTQNISIKPHEQRAINFLINEYLLQQGYKLTSITFSDENENQDFEDWDDVGLNISRPMELLSLYREALKGSGYSVNSHDFGCQVTLYDELEHNVHVSELEAEINELTNKIALLGLEFSKKLHSLENQKTIDTESRNSLTPDQEYFEMIDNLKSREESETKSDRSNGDWTKIGDRYKKESIDLKSDNQSNFESISVDDKSENRSNLQKGEVEVNEESTEDSVKHEDYQEIEIEQNSEPLKLADNFNETISDALDNELGTDDSSKVVTVQITNDDLNNLENENCKLLNFISSTREMPDGFKKEILKHCDMNMPTGDYEILTDSFYQTPIAEVTANQIIEVLSTSLPKIIPNIILNKREEITPLLILSVCLNPDASARDKLLNLLFNLKKKPQPEERRVILRALLFIAQLMGSNTVENEVLPQCWEQIAHKYIERRMLVAESCFVLAPYVSETIRNSLIVSIAQQLLQDREENIRKAAVNIMALLIALMSDEDKYTQILDICLQLTNDESAIVLNSVKYLLYPALAQWSFTLKRVQSDLFNKLLNKLKKEKNLCLVNISEILLPYLIMTMADSQYLLQYSSKNHSPPSERQEFHNLCKGLCDPVLFYQGKLEIVLKSFDSCASETEIDASQWQELEWVLNEFIPALIETGDASLENADVLIGLISTLRHLCLGLGKNLTNQKIKPFLSTKLQDCENALVAGEECQYSVIPLYLVGVLSMDPEALQEMSNTLHRFICALPLCGVSLTPLQVAIEALSQFQNWQILVLDAVWEGVVHQRPLVRSASATLFQSAIPFIPESLLSTKVTPALVTLSSDPEISVKTCSIPTLGMLINAKEKAIKDKVYMTLQSLLQEGSSLENHSMVVQLIKTIRVIYENCDRHFREEVIIPQLASIAAISSQTRSSDLVQVLIEAFSAISFSHSPLSYQCISSALLPGLRYLETTCSQQNLPYLEHVDSMIKEVERRSSATRDPVVKSAIMSPTSEAKKLIPNAVSTHVVVEDVKNRVTKIFNTRPNNLPNVSGIFKKKT